MSKLLTIDAGNSNIVLGLYNDNKIVHQWRVHTDRKKLSDEYADLIESLLAKRDIDYKDIENIAISNVVPSLQNLLENMVITRFNKKPFFVNWKNIMNMSIKIDNPEELGADLIAAAAASIKNYGSPCIIIDFGTATTLTVINDKNEFLGGAIAPGIIVSCEALYTYAPHLPQIKLKHPPSVIGTNTIESMQSGILLGYSHMIEGLIKDTKKIIGEKAKVIATGGLAGIFQEGSDILDIVDRYLVLDGVKLLYEMNLVHN